MQLGLSFFPLLLDYQLFLYHIISIVSLGCCCTHAIKYFVVQLAVPVYQILQLLFQCCTCNLYVYYHIYVATMVMFFTVGIWQELYEHVCWNPIILSQFVSFGSSSNNLIWSSVISYWRLTFSSCFDVHIASSEEQEIYKLSTFCPSPR
jgi:hypothetical protein